MSTAASPLFEVAVVAQTIALSQPGDAMLLNPALVLGAGVQMSVQLVTAEGTWTPGPNRGTVILTDSAGVSQNIALPYSDCEVMYINRGGAPWVRSPTHGYACRKAGTWNWANCAGTGGSAPL